MIKKILTALKIFWQNNLRTILFYVFLVPVLIFVVVLPTLGDSGFQKIPARLVSALPLVVFLVVLRNIKSHQLFGEFTLISLVFSGGGFFLAYNNSINPSIVSFLNTEWVIALVVLFAACIGLLLVFQDRLGTFWRRTVLLPIVLCEIVFGILMGLELYLPPPPPTPYWGGCFIEGTLVWTPDGMSSIESIRAGNVVYAYDTQLAVVVEATVINVIPKTRTELLTIGKKLQVTPEHPMAVIHNGDVIWKEANKLSIGDCLVSETGSCVEIHSIVRHQNLASPVSVINLSVSEPNNFFVIMGDKPVLVHNKTVPCVGCP